MVAVSFIGGGNQSTQRKSPICRKSLTNQKLVHNMAVVNEFPVHAECRVFFACNRQLEHTTSKWDAPGSGEARPYFYTLCFTNG